MMDERKAFEAWQLSRKPSYPAEWEAWQAATAAERERCAKAVDNWMRREDMTGDDIRKG